MAKSYSEKLRDPRWQKRRLEALYRDNFTCVSCGDNKTELHVHHESYSGEPWDIELDKIKTMCRHCHYVREKFNPHTYGATHIRTSKGTMLIHRTDIQYMVFYFDKLSKYESCEGVSFVLVDRLVEFHLKSL